MDNICFLNAHRLCNLSLSLLLLYLRRTERVDGVGWPVSVSRMYPALYLSQFVKCISPSLSNVFLPVCQIIPLSLSNIFISFCQMYQFAKCISFSLFTAFLPFCQLHFLIFSTLLISVYPLHFLLIFKYVCLRMTYKN